MGEKLDAVGRGVSILAKVMVSVLWIAVGAIAVAAGQPLLLLVVIPYLIYLWLFGGRWLIY